MGKYGKAGSRKGVGEQRSPKKWAWSFRRNGYGAIKGRVYNSKVLAVTVKRQLIEWRVEQRPKQK